MTIFQQAPEDTFVEQEISVEELKEEVKDSIPPATAKAIKRHNDMIVKINVLEERIDALSPFELSKLEFFYNKLEREAWKIAGYFKSQYQFYYGRASTERGNSYVYERDVNKRNINDSNYASRKVEGANLEHSGIYEGYFVTWRGIAQSYAGMQNTLKDMIKAVKVEGGEQS